MWMVCGRLEQPRHRRTKQRCFRHLCSIALIILLFTSLAQAACPDGVIDAGEECDDGNSNISDGCSNCMIDLGYECSGTPSTCTNTYHCGDGTRDAQEECDDGNNLPFDGCSPECKIYTGWECAGSTPDTCTEICGDGLDFHTYACDDGNTIYEDGCSPLCTIYADFMCGGGGAGTRDYCFEVNLDGADYGWYGCDDGNTNTCDGCDQYGRIEPGYTCNQGRPYLADRCWPDCGDGLRVCPEECDDGNNNNADGCSATCTVEIGYTCAGGNYWRADFCYEICGDGVDIGYYDCDDGNIIDGDGCDDSCVIELGFDCVGGLPYDVTTPVNGVTVLSNQDTCTEICGDGLDFFYYPCDDGNLVNGDGCDSNCDIEPGWDCQYGTNDWHDECWHWHNNPAIVNSTIVDDTMLYIDFNVSVTIPTTWNDYLELELTINGPREERRYYEYASYELLNKATDLMTPNSASEWIVNITYEDSIQFLGDGVENITLKVIDRRQVTHFSYGFILINDEVSAIVYDPSENDKECDMESWWEVAYILYICLVINNFSFFLIGASLWHTIGITMSLQMIIYFPMMHNYPPSCLSKFFKDFQIVVGKQDLLNLQEMLLGLYDEDLQPVGKTNYRFERQGFVTYNMLVNAIEMLMLYACFLASMVVLFLLRILCCNNANVAWYETRNRWELGVKGFVLIYLHVMICCLLNMTHPDTEESIDKTATSLSYVIFGIMAGGYVLIFLMTMYYKVLGPIGKEKWFFRNLWRDIDTSSAPKYFFYVFYLAKRTAYALSFGLLFDEGLTPMNLTYVFVVFLPLMYLCFARPFTHRLTNIHMIYNEMNELLIISLYYYYYDPWLKDWQFYEYARITVIDIAVWVIVSYIIFLLSLPRFCRIKCPKKKPKIYLPEYEEEIEQEIESPVSSEHDFVIPAAHVEANDNKRNDSYSSEEKDDREREIIDDDLEEELDELERDPNANI